MSERQPRKAIIECIDGPEMLGFTADGPLSVVAAWLGHHDAIENEQEPSAASDRPE